MSQSQPLQIENPHYASFGTSRTINSRLWFINNQELEERTLGYLAKYQLSHKIELFAYVISGSHDHPLARFPECNRSAFYRDFNARKAEAVRALVDEFPGGPLFERRYAAQALPLNEDVEKYFFYCALQPVSAGLCERISEYPGYNSFTDAIYGRARKVKVVDNGRFNAARRYNLRVSKEDYTTTYTLRYKRLPGYEHLSQKEYAKLMLKKLEEHRAKIVAAIKAEGRTFLGRERLLAQEPGTAAKNPKKSKPYSRRPLVLSVCKEAKAQFLEWYFSVYSEYKRAVKKYLAGNLSVKFPPGTYRPPSAVAVPT